MNDVLAALLATTNPPTNYGLTVGDVTAIAACYDWENRVTESNWGQNTNYDTLAEMVAAEPASFLADISRYYGDDQYLDQSDIEYEDDSMDGDAESALASAGFGTDEDYGFDGGDDEC